MKWGPPGRNCVLVHGGDERHLSGQPESDAAKGAALSGGPERGWATALPCAARSALPSWPLPCHCPSTTPSNIYNRSFVSECQKLASIGTYMRTRHAPKLWDRILLAQIAPHMPLMRVSNKSVLRKACTRHPTGQPRAKVQRRTSLLTPRSTKALSSGTVHLVAHERASLPRALDPTKLYTSAHTCHNAHRLATQALARKNG